MLRILPLSWIALVFLHVPLTAAQCPSDDAFEDNDTEATASILPPGLTTNLRLLGHGVGGVEDLDYWRIPNVPAGHRVEVDVVNVSAMNPLHIRLGATQVGSPVVKLSVLASVHLVAANVVSFPQDFILSLEHFEAGAICAEYTINLIVVPDACAMAGPDAFEENDDCSSAAPILPGVYSGLQMAITDRDYYSIQVPPAYELVVDQIDSGFARGLALDVVPLCAGAATEWYQQAINGAAGARSLTHANSTGATQTVQIYSLVWNDSCALYDLSITLTPGLCSNPVDDSFEPNDDCATAAALTPGMYAGLFVSKANPDCYAIQVLPGRELIIDQPNPLGPGELQLELFLDAACAVPAAMTIGNDGLNRIEWINPDLGANAIVYARTTIRPDAVANCTDYDLSVTSSANSCSGGLILDDHAFPNQLCTNAAPLFWGLDPGLAALETRGDYFETTLHDGEFLFAEVWTHELYAKLEMYVFDDSADCGNLVDGYLARGTTDQFGHATVSYIHPDLTPANYRLLVRVADDSQLNCTQYDLFARNAGGSQLQHTFCFGDGTAGPQGAHDLACPCSNPSAPGSRQGCANSLGHGATISAIGSANVLDGESLRFKLAGARANQPAMLMQGASLFALPFKDGIICVGFPTERVEVVFVGPNSEAITTSNIAVEGSNSYGDRRYYQFWYRDPAVSPCGTGSNLSSAAAVEWR